MVHVTLYAEASLIEALLVRPGTYTEIELSERRALDNAHASWTRNFQYLSSINLASTSEILEKKSFDKFWRKWRFSGFMFRDFRQKRGKSLKASRMYSFEVKHNPQTPNYVNFSALRNGYLTFLIFSILTQKIKISFFK